MTHQKTILPNQATRQFADNHRTDDVRRLALRTLADAEVDKTMALQQIDGWQRARQKLPRWAATRGVLFPPRLAMEQCSSETAARYKAAIAARLAATHHNMGTLLTDLTGGFGVDFTLMAEALAPARCVYVERQADLCALAANNLAAFGLSHAVTENADSTDYLDQMGETCLLFLDPARRDSHGSRTYALADCTPNVVEWLPRLRRKCAWLMLKLSPMLDWHRVAAQLAGALVQLHIVAVGGECKELLAVVRGEAGGPGGQTDDEIGQKTPSADDRPAQDRPGFTVSCVADGAVEFVFSTDDAQEPPVTWAAPQAGQWLHVPDAALMKAGCFGHLCRRFDVAAVGPNSHLFVSEGERSGFPGRSFLISAISSLHGPSLKQALSGLTHANIAVRNFPMRADELRRKLRLKDGGDTFVFATTLADNSRRLLFARKNP